MDNLINNGIQAAGLSGSVELRAEQQGEDVVIRVLDNGPGLTSEQLALGSSGFKNVFLLNNSTKVGGTGLGTTQAKLAVEANGGTIDAQNQVKGGAEFIIKIPLVNQESAAMKREIQGGIDFNEISVARTGNKINIEFDPAQLNNFLRGGFEGFSFEIKSMTPISSPFPLLGINVPRRQEELLAKV